MPSGKKRISLIFVFLIIFIFFTLDTVPNAHAQQTNNSDSLDTTFDQASKEFQVPVALLKTICYMEGRLSNHQGYPSVDRGYGCMHLVKNDRINTLYTAASLIHDNPDHLKQDIQTNIRGGAALLLQKALEISPNQTLPTSLQEWYGAVAAYSNATTRSSALMYADAVFDIMKNGFNAPDESGNIITLFPQNIFPNKHTADKVQPITNLPQGCVNDGKTDYPGAIDCPLDASVYNCNLVSATAPCTYEDAHRPQDFPILFVGIHDIEGTVQDALNIFQDPNSSVSVHYIVDTDGTVYQMIRENDIAYHIGNFWYNQRSVGIEHAGFDATGFQWYNAAEYLGSAKLTAYLLKKYHIPLDHDHIISHGTVPAPTLGTSPNHVDPGPYWLWDYYLSLIHNQNIPYPNLGFHEHIFSLHPYTDMQPSNPNGTETAANFNFFYLYTGPSTKSDLIPSASSGDIMDETNNVEPAISYYYLDKVIDPARSGNILYKIWYGENDQLHNANGQIKAGASNDLNKKYNVENDRPKGGASSDTAIKDTTSSWFADAKTAWLSVPFSSVDEGNGTAITIGSSSATVSVYGRPVSNDNYIIGNSPNNAVFVSAFSVVENNTNIHWYEINYNHRQAWIPSQEIIQINRNPF